MASCDSFSGGSKNQLKAENDSLLMELTQRNACLLYTSVAQARIEGFQGCNYDEKRTVLACAKHFAAYGAAVGGRYYAEADISEHTLQQFYLPPFQAAVEAGVATFMNAFNEINGIPATAHKILQRDV